MKFLKSVLVTIVILITVKACFYVSSSMSGYEAEASTLTEEMDDMEPSSESETVAVAPTTEAGASNRDTSQRFIRHNAGFGVSVEIPEDWYVLPQEQISAIRADADMIYPDADNTKVTPFAANSSPDSQLNEALVRISFQPLEFDETDLRAVNNLELDALCDSLYNAWVENTPGLRIIGRPQCSTTKLNGKPALLTKYKRQGQTSDRTWTVNLLQVPLREKTAMITYSRIDDSVAADQIVANISRSLRFN